MKQNEDLAFAFVLPVAMMVAYFFLPLVSGGDNPWLSEMKISMWDALISGISVGRLWALLLLLAPIYYMLDSFKEKLSIPKVLFPLPSSITAILPLVIIVLAGCYLNGGSPVSKMEDGGTFGNVAAIGDHTGWGYYVYLAAATIAMATTTLSFKDKRPIASEKAIIIAVGAVLLMIVMMTQAALSSDTSRSIFKFDRNMNVSLYGMMVGYGWIFVLVLIYMAIAAFREEKFMAGVRKCLLSPKVISIVTLVAGLVAIFFSVGFSSTGKCTMGPASISYTVIALGIVLIAFKKEITKAETLTDNVQPAQEKLSPSITNEQVKESMAKAKENITLKSEQAKAWGVKNAKKIGIGAGIVAVVALLAWLIPQFVGNAPISFETLEVRDDEGFDAAVDIPIGDSEKAQNVAKGICELIAQTNMASELGEPLQGGTLQEVINDYKERYKQYIKNLKEENGVPVGPICQLYINSDSQNEACAVFEVAGSIYMNGAPDTYLRTVRLADGHVMQMQEMMTITANELEPLIAKYQKEEMPIWLEDGFYIVPAGSDSCRATWPNGHSYIELMIPLSEMSPYLTDAGREIFEAKSFSRTVRSEAGFESTETETENVAPAGDEEPIDEEYDEEEYVVEGLLGSLPAGKTEYVGEMAGFPIEFTITKDDNGINALYRNVKYSTTMNLIGESLPADGGNITFLGHDSNGNDWSFYLDGDAENITGTAQGGGKELPVTLHKKN